MVPNVTRDVYRELRKIFPQLPEHLIFLDLELHHKSLPILKVGFYPDPAQLDADGEAYKVFEIRERQPAQSQTDADAAPPQTAASSSE